VLKEANAPESSSMSAKGGKARSAKLSPAERSAIAKKASAKRWAKKKELKPAQTPNFPPAIDMPPPVVTARVPVPPTKYVSGSVEKLLRLVLEDHVPRPINRKGMGKLAQAIYGREDTVTINNVRSLIQTHIRKGNLKPVGHGEFDLT
jgi:hypothetical protein